MARFRNQSTPAAKTEETQPSTTPDAGDSVVIEVPVAESDGAAPHHISIQLWTPDAREGARRLLAGMRASGTKRRDTGREIESYADALRYVLESIGQAADAA